MDRSAMKGLTAGGRWIMKAGTAAEKYREWLQDKNKTPNVSSCEFLKTEASKAPTKHLCFINTIFFFTQI